MPTQYLVGKCGHCHNGILTMIRSTLKITEEKISAHFECMNPLCNNIITLIIYANNRDEFYKDWQRDISDQYCPPT